MFKTISSSSMWLKVLAVAVGVYIGLTLTDNIDSELIRGKNVIITGASTGIGEQMAYHYARLGAKLLITARREHVLQKVIERCKEIGGPEGEFHYFVADMADLSATKLLIEHAESVLGGIDYLVLNHIALSPVAPWVGSDKNLTLVDTLYTVNTKSYIHLTSHALPLLEQSRGHIVAVSSLAGKVPHPYIISYSSSKFALDGFFSGLRIEFSLRKIDVSVTLCLLGFVGTENAVQQLKNYGFKGIVDYVPMSTPSSAALAIVKGGADRAREVYYPFMQVRSMTLLRDIIPGTLAQIIGLVFSH